MSAGLCVCGAAGTLRCGSCRGVQYCSKDRQVAHWQEHKARCKEIRDTIYNGKDASLEEEELVTPQNVVFPPGVPRIGHTQEMLRTAAYQGKISLVAECISGLEADLMATCFDPKFGVKMSTRAPGGYLMIVQVWSLSTFNFSDENSERMLDTIDSALAMAS